MTEEMQPGKSGSEASGGLGVGGERGGVAPKRSVGERSEPTRSEGATPPRRAAAGTLSPRENSGMPEHGPQGDRVVKAIPAQNFSAPNPEVSSKPARRRHTVAYKLEILREAERCKERGAIGALLRREGLYTGSLQDWRRQRNQGLLDPQNPRKRGRKAHPVNPLARKLAESERDNRRLQKRLEKAELIIDFQKKVHALLGIPLNLPEDVESES